MSRVIPTYRELRIDIGSSYGEFETTRDCSDFTSAHFLSQVGKKTPVLQRVSTVGPESGSADTSRDVHGWAMKFYTEEGNQDFVFNNTVRHHQFLLKPCVSFVY